MPVNIVSEVQDGNGDYIYFWSTQAPNPSTEDNIIVTFPSSETVYLTVQDSCGTRVTDSVFVSYPEYDDLQLDVVIEKRTCPETPLAFEVTASGGAGNYLYFWGEEDDLGSFESANAARTLYTTEPGFNFIELRVQDQCFGLVNNAFLMPYISIREEFDTLKTIDLRKIPNVITPNGDRFNDYFAVPGLDIFEGTGYQVWNRWGNEIFVSNDYRIGQPPAENAGVPSGAFDGAGSEDGSYFYVLNVNGGECVKSGYIQILGSDGPQAGR